MADNLGSGASPCSLRIVDMPGQCVDDLRINRRAFGRNQGRPMLTAKVIMDDAPMVMIGDDRSLPDLSYSPENSRCASGNNDLVVAAAGGNILADMKVEFRVGNSLMEISREIHWHSPKVAVTLADDLAMTS